MTKGYNPEFLGDEHTVPWPKFTKKQKARFAQLKEKEEFILDYGHFSVIVDRERRFPAITASNISGPDFKKVTRKMLFKGGSDRWKKDRRLDRTHQWGSALYRAKLSDFDRGHMTKREDVQWGTKKQAADAARSTFYYTNAVPQHKRVNQSIWREIEDFVLKQETVVKDLRICVFTGPVLLKEDPNFVTPVKGITVQLPIAFWKIIYYISESGHLSRVAFLVGQKPLLEKHGIVEKPKPVRGKRAHFMNFDEADTFQVNISAVEGLTGYKFPEARNAYADYRPLKLVIEEVQVKRGEPIPPGGKQKVVGLTL